MDKTLLKNILIVAVILSLTASLITCALANKEKIKRLVIEENADFYMQPSPRITDNQTKTETSNAESTPGQTKTHETTGTAETEIQVTHIPDETPGPSPKIVMTDEEEMEGSSDEKESSPDNATPAQKDDSNQNAEKDEYRPLVITVTKQSGSASVYLKEIVNDAGKYITVKKTVKKNTYTFTINYKSPGVTQLAFLYDNGRFTLPSYFYIYDVVTTEDGKINGKLAGEYSYSQSKNQYMELSFRHAFVDTSVVHYILKKFGVILIMPTPIPTITPGPSGNSQMTPTAAIETTVKGAVETMVFNEHHSLNSWVISDNYNKKIIKAERLVEIKGDKSTDFKFLFTSLDNPGYTNVCIAHYNSVDGVLLLDEINIFRITVKENGRIDIDKTIFIQRDEDGTFGENQKIVETLIKQFTLNPLINP